MGLSATFLAFSCEHATKVSSRQLDIRSLIIVFPNVVVMYVLVLAMRLFAFILARHFTSTAQQNYAEIQFF